MSTLSEETGRHRDTLMAANKQLTLLKAQLDRAVEQKVNKKFGQRLKVSGSAGARSLSTEMLCQCF